MGRISVCDLIGGRVLWRVSFAASKDSHCFQDALCFLFVGREVSSRLLLWLCRCSAITGASPPELESQLKLSFSISCLGCGVLSQQQKCNCDAASVCPSLADVGLESRYWSVQALGPLSSLQCTVQRHTDSYRGGGSLFKWRHWRPGGVPCRPCGPAPRQKSKMG